MSKVLALRLQKLEARAAANTSSLHDLLLTALTGGYDESAFDEWFTTGGNEACNFGWLPDPRERGIASVLFDGLNIYKGKGRFELERFRGIVSDPVLSTVYDRMRNYGGDAATVLRVRQRAGVVDQDGVPLPGYVLADNGCILDAAPQVPQRA